MSISSDFEYLATYNLDFHTNPKLNLKTPLCTLILIKAISQRYPSTANLMDAFAG